jgi:hypothetical protein
MSLHKLDIYEFDIGKFQNKKRYFMHCFVNVHHDIKKCGLFSDEPDVEIERPQRVMRYDHQSGAYTNTRRINFIAIAKRPPTSVTVSWETTDALQTEPELRMCSKCNDYGHARRNCRNGPKCGLCAGPHLTKQCSIDRQTGQRKCPNCPGQHSARYGGCQKRLAIIALLEEKKGKTNSNIANATQNKVPPSAAANGNVVTQSRFAQANKSYASASSQKSTAATLNVSNMETPPEPPAVVTSPTDVEPPAVEILQVTPITDSPSPTNDVTLRNPPNQGNTEGLSNDEFPPLSPAIPEHTHIASQHTQHTTHTHDDKQHNKHTRTNTHNKHTPNNMQHTLPDDIPAHIVSLERAFNAFIEKQKVEFQLFLKNIKHQYGY